MSRVLIDNKEIIKRLSERHSFPENRIEDMILYVEKTVKDEMRSPDLNEIAIDEFMKFAPNVMTIGSLIKYKYLHYLKVRVLTGEKKLLKTYEKEFGYLMNHFLKLAEDRRNRVRAEHRKKYWQKIFNELK